MDSLTGACCATVCKDGTGYFEFFFDEKRVVFTINNYEYCWVLYKALGDTVNRSHPCPQNPIPPPKELSV